MYPVTWTQSGLLLGDRERVGRKHAFPRSSRKLCTSLAPSRLQREQELIKGQSCKQQGGTSPGEGTCGPTPSDTTVAASRTFLPSSGRG